MVPCAGKLRRTPLAAAGGFEHGEYLHGLRVERVALGPQLADGAHGPFGAPGNFTTASKAGLGLPSPSKRSGRPRLRQELASLAPQKVTNFTASRCLRK